MKDIVEERMPMYGDPVPRMEAIDKIMDTLLNLNANSGGQRMPEGMSHVISMLVDKLTRTVINPSLEDHWDDLRGYSKIGSEIASRHQ